MIKELHIVNLAVIEDTTLEFQSTYTALIGETGAGKSLVVDSLMLLSGERCDFSLIRDKDKKASVSAVFSFDDEYIQLHDELKDYLDENNELLLKRILNPDKTSRCYCNGEILSLNEYKILTSHLIDIHSQNGKNDLLNESKQIRYVDAYGKKTIKPLKEEYQKNFREYKNLQDQLDNLISSNKELDRDYLSFQIAEIEKFHLQENEIESLNEEFNSYRDYDRLKDKYDAYQESCQVGETSLSQRLSSAISKLHGFLDTELNEPAKEAEMACQNALYSLRSFEEAFMDIAVDPKRIDEINERLFSLKGLQRKYGKTTEEILSKYQDYKIKLNQLDSFEDEKKDLENQIEKTRLICLDWANKLTIARIKAGEQLSKAIGNEMADLGLRKNAFKVDVLECELGSEGKDKISFQVALNEGLEPSSLAKAASGGESSRLMLSLKVVFNALDPYSLLVFDEIDTGVSGKTASLIAKKIKLISHDSPLIVISHLPQVVASCSSAVKIEKTTVDHATITKATTLDYSSIKECVARMLSGDTVTEAALQQAESLIQEYK